MFQCLANVTELLKPSVNIEQLRRTLLFLVLLKPFAYLWQFDICSIPIRLKIFHFALKHGLQKITK